MGVWCWLVWYWLVLGQDQRPGSPVVILGHVITGSCVVMASVWTGMMAVLVWRVCSVLGYEEEEREAWPGAPWPGTPWSGTPWPGTPACPAAWHAVCSRPGPGVYTRSCNRTTGRGVHSATSRKYRTEAILDTALNKQCSVVMYIIVLNKSL